LSSSAWSSGRLIATDFLKLPNKRLYPDYYEVIKQPVALDDVEVRPACCMVLAASSG
jgi:hypothetical protein